MFNIGDTQYEGDIPGFVDARLNLDGTRYSAYSKLTCGHSRNRQKVYGQQKSGLPMGVTKGEYATDEATLECPWASANALKREFASKSESGNNYGDAVVKSMVYQAAQGSQTLKREFTNVRWVGDTMDTAVGNEATIVQVKWSYDEIIDDGMRLSGEE